MFKELKSKMNYCKLATMFFPFLKDQLIWLLHSILFIETHLGTHNSCVCVSKERGKSEALKQHVFWIIQLIIAVTGFIYVLRAWKSSVHRLRLREQMTDKQWFFTNLAASAPITFGFFFSPVTLVVTFTI